MTGPRALSLAAVIGAAALALVFRHRLPLTMVVHWGANDRPDGYASRDFAIAIVPAIGASIWAFLRLLPRAGGTRRLADPHSSYEKIGAAIQLTLLGAQVLIVSWNLGLRMDVARCSLAGVSTLIAVIGNYLGKLPPNSAFGLRNRWILSSQAAWRKVHRRTGMVMFVGGAGFTAAAMLAPAGEETTLALTVSLVLLAICPPVAAFAFSALEAHRAR